MRKITPKQLPSNTGISVAAGLLVTVALDPAERAAIKRDIVKMNYGRKACIFARINFRTFRKALKGHPIKVDQRNKLVRFCELVKQLQAA